MNMLRLVNKFEFVQLQGIDTYDTKISPFIRAAFASKYLIYANYSHLNYKAQPHKRY